MKYMLIIYGNQELWSSIDPADYATLRAPAPYDLFLIETARRHPGRRYPAIAVAFPQRSLTHALHVYRYACPRDAADT